MGPRSSNGNGAHPAVGPEPAAPPADPPIDLGRVGAAVRRQGALVVAIVAFVVIVVLAASLRAPLRYDATARIASEGNASATASDPGSLATGLATSRELATAPAVLTAAARKLPGATASSLAGAVTASVETDASILDVTASAGDPRRAARIATTVAESFLSLRTAAQRAAAERARAVLQTQLAAVPNRNNPNSLATALRERISDLAVSQATAGSDLRLAEAATVPTSASAPRPLRNAVFAGLSALLLAVVVAVVRDRSRRRAAEARELAARAGLPLLAVVPDGGGIATRAVRALIRLLPLGGRRESDQAIVEQAALQAAVRTALPPRAARTVLVCGIDGGEGSARVAAGLTRSLSWAGLDAALVDSTARGPTDDALDEARRGGHRYVIVNAPAVNGSSGLPLLAWQASAAVLVGRLGRTSGGEVLTCAQLLGALDVPLLGLVLTAPAADAAAIREGGFEPPTAVPRRVRRANEPSDAEPSRQIAG
jgi:capsular polysaccharide biosynthesis protein